MRYGRVVSVVFLGQLACAQHENGVSRDAAGGAVADAGAAADQQPAEMSAIDVALAPQDSSVVSDALADAPASNPDAAALDLTVLSDAPVADAATSARWRPAPGTSWQIQLTATVDTSVDVQVFDLDLFDVPQAQIDALHAAGHKVICYFSAGSHEDWRADAKQFPAAVIGKPLDGWPGEHWLDTRAEAVRTIMKQRLDHAVARRCDGVDPDNVDGYTNGPGFPLTAATQLDYNRFLAHEAHARGLSVGLKNDVGQAAALAPDFDWAVNESCLQYDECDTLAPFIKQGVAVFHIEYGDAAAADKICPRTKPLGFSTLIKKLDLGAWRVACP